MSEQPTTAREWALVYGRLGWRVFPVVPGGKRPLYRGWQRDATSDPEQIGRYWRSEPGPNIGVVTGEAFDAFDIEVDHLDAIRTFMREGGFSLPLSPIARTGRGGIHILAAPTGLGGGHDLYLRGVHIGEFKSVGGFIVVCPSVTVGAYVWRVPPDDAPVAAVPAWLVDFAKRPSGLPRRPAARIASVAEGERTLTRLVGAVRAAGEGRRNSLLYWAVRRAVDEGVPSGLAGRVLARAALAAGLTESEIGATVRSARGGGQS
ncbi:MAG: bifunctional DNA primase/polymerase [Chloroflexi bacterium]|nr:bifunctional DNA primase/polymerase [Chloroflexota bacterium]